MGGLAFSLLCCFTSLMTGPGPFNTPGFDPRIVHLDCDGDFDLDLKDFSVFMNRLPVDGECWSVCP